MTRQHVPAPIDQRGNEQHRWHTIQYQRSTRQYHVLSKTTGAVLDTCATRQEARDAIEAFEHNGTR